MKGIDTLIRLHRQHLDVKRVYRTDMETQRFELENRIRALQLDFENERKIAAVTLEARQTFPAYGERMTRSLRALAGEMIEVDAEIERLNDEIAEAFQTLKGYELTRDARATRAAEEQARRERHQLDEIGATQHRRSMTPYTKEQ